MNVRIGINPITWTDDDVPDLGGDIPLDVCLTEAKQADYAGIELGCKFPRQSAVLRPIMERYGLAVISGWYDGRCAEGDVDAAMAAIGPHLQLLKDMGCTHVVHADTSRGRHGAIWRPISEGPSLLAGEWADYGRKLAMLAERRADFGMGMAFHHHMETIVETDAEVGHLMRHSGEAVGLLYDTGHSAMSAGDPLAMLKTHLARVVHVHSKNTRPGHGGQGAGGRHELHGCRHGGCLHGARQRQHRLLRHPEGPARFRLCRMADGRSGTGPEEGPTADLCDDGVPEPRTHCERGGVHGHELKHLSGETVL